jgi:hypothetical protein
MANNSEEGQGSQRGVVKVVMTTTTTTMMMMMRQGENVVSSTENSRHDQHDRRSLPQSCASWYTVSVSLAQARLVQACIITIHSIFKPLVQLQCLCKIISQMLKYACTKRLIMQACQACSYVCSHLYERKADDVKPGSTFRAGSSLPTSHFFFSLLLSSGMRRGHVTCPRHYDSRCVQQFRSVGYGQILRGWPIEPAFRIRHRFHRRVRHAEDSVAT